MCFWYSSGMKIEFISDISCPWCAIGLNAFERAVERLGDDLVVDFHVEPFELNPQMPREGEDIVEHLAHKYGATAEQARRNHEAIRERGAAVGFTFDLARRSRIWNTFDAHRLLHWAGVQGEDRQRALKHKLFEANFTHGENPGDPEVLERLAAEVGLDAARAHEVLASGAYADEVRERERHWTEAGIHAVPAFVVDGKYLIQGGQPPEVFEKALREIAAQSDGRKAAS
jgi:predicted DsbA family dithiol-disulfide isomerase